jgi:hypothetical protein
MAHYFFDQWCRPRRDFRIPDMLDFFDLVKEAFRCPTLYDSRGKPLDLTTARLREILEKKAARLLPATGAVVHFFTMPPRMRDDRTVRIEISTGHDPEEGFIDAYNLSIGEWRKVPNFDYFEKSIELFEPFEAYLSESENEYRLDSFNRQREMPGFTKPAIIRSFHYLDKDMADSIGGIAYCLKAPVWHVEKFCQGVLIELIPGPFDHENPEHRRIQEDVMAYFGLL